MTSEPVWSGEEANEEEEGVSFSEEEGVSRVIVTVGVVLGCGSEAVTDVLEAGEECGFGAE